MSLPVLIKRADLEAIARGEIRLAFRRWRRPTVRAGGTLRTAVGVLAIDAVEAVEAGTITEEDAGRAGFGSREALLAALKRRDGGRLYRIELRLAGPDPRAALRRRAALTERERSEIRRRLARWDRASPQGPWTDAILASIAERPATRGAESAAAAGFETRWFKVKVRKLKELGLTESLGIGYRLSPRGRAYLRKGAGES